MPFVGVKVTVPKEILNAQKVRQAIIDAQNNQTRPKVLKLFGQTVTGWKDAPVFRSRRIDTANQLGIQIYADGPNSDQYALVNGGAKPHVIRPRRARMLRFQRGYRASTRPRVLSSSAYARSGQFVAARMVQHPGFAAREFDQEIADKHGPEFENDMRDAIRGAT